jgi:hypothetical protein
MLTRKIQRKGQLRKIWCSLECDNKIFPAVTRSKNANCKTQVKLNLPLDNYVIPAQLAAAKAQKRRSTMGL